jgi:hypothetical protein
MFQLRLVIQIGDTVIWFYSLMAGMEIFEKVLLEYIRLYRHYFWGVNVILNIIEWATISIATDILFLFDILFIIQLCIMFFGEDHNFVNVST